MTGDSDRPGAGKSVSVLITVVALIVGTALGISAMRTTALSFDGALNAQAAVNLLEKGRYGLGYDENIEDFDHRLQTGPTVVLPSALSFRFFGVNNDTAEFANLVYFVLFFVAAALYANRHGGAASALVAILVLAQTPRLGPLGLGFYGEVPALVFFLGGLLLIDRLDAGPTIGVASTVGVLFGLSILTKIVMLIPVSSVLLVVLIASITSRRILLRHWAAITVGVALPIAAFETVKLFVLGPPVWVDWWAVMIRRTAGQGLPLGMPDTPGTLPKATTHLGILSDITGVPLWSVLLLVAVPTLMLFLLWRAKRIDDRSHAFVPTSLVSVWLAASCFLCWWLLLTPTSRAWPRRVLVGLLLQELLASILVVVAIGWILRRGRGEGSGEGRSTLRIIIVGVAAGLLLVSLSTLLVHNLPRVELRTEPYTNRRSIEYVADFMRSRPSDAVFYGRGWYRAPVLALLSGREVLDFNEVPISSYGVPLSETYFVVDGHFSRFKPKEAKEVLARSVYHAVVRAGNCSLFQLQKILPYPPIPKPDDNSDLLTRRGPKNGDYPFVGGLGKEAPNGQNSRAVSGFLLERGDHECLRVDLWPSPKVGEKPTLEVRIDHQIVHVGEPVAGRPWHQLIALGEDTEPDTMGSLVELWMHIDRPQQKYSLWTSDKDTFIVRDVGFVPCKGQRALEAPPG
jgi:hypothetical protein